MRYEFTHAWCEQLRRRVTIDEAYAEACAVSPPLVFTFRCPDDRCRTANNPLIAAANYRVDVHQGGRKRMRYFRSDDRHPHIRGCTCEVSAVKRVRPSAPPMSSDPVKATDVVDAFVPATNDGPPPGAGKPRVASQPAAEDEANGTGTGHATERRLSRVASVFQRLRADDALRDNQLVIAGETYSYYRGVLPPKLLRPHEVLRRIVRGNAKLERAAPDPDSGWVMSFYDQLEYFEPHHDSRSLRIDLDGGRLKASARGVRIAAEIERLHDDRNYAEVFFFGDIQEHRDAGYAVVLDSLFNLVVFPPGPQRAPMLDCGRSPYPAIAVHQRYTDQLFVAPINFAKLLSLNYFSLCPASPRCGCIACTYADARKLLIRRSLVRAQVGEPKF